MNQYLFFVSTGRTGTHFLQQFFDANVDDCLSLHEPKPAFKRRGYELVSRSYSTYERLYFSLFRKARIFSSGAQYYIEANNCLFSSIDLIRDVFSDSTVVYIIRDGRDVVASYMNSFKRYSKDPRGNKQLSPDHFQDDPYKDRWDKMNPVAKMSWFWLRVNEVIEESNPDLTVKFGKLFSPPHRPLRKIIDHLDGVNISQETIERAFKEKESSSSIDYIPDWEEWPSHWKEQFVEICGEKMEEYGYEL